MSDLLFPRRSEFVGLESGRSLNVAAAGVEISAPISVSVSEPNCYVSFSASIPVARALAVALVAAADHYEAQLAATRRASQPINAR